MQTPLACTSAAPLGFGPGQWIAPKIDVFLIDFHESSGFYHNKFDGFHQHLLKINLDGRQYGKLRSPRGGALVLGVHLRLDFRQEGPQLHFH